MHIWPRHIGRRAAGWALSGLASLASCREAPKLEGARPIPVRVTALQHTPLEAAVSYAGEIVPRVETQLAFLVPGRVERRWVDVGSRVRADQVLAQLESADYQIASASASAAMAENRAALRQSELELDRSTRLLESSALAKSTFDQSQMAADTARARVDRARTGVDRSSRDLASTRLRSPVNGVITAVTVEVGQVVSAGQPMIRVASAETSEVAVDIPEARISQIRPGAEATVRLWIDSAETYTAHVREVSPQSDPATRTYRVKLTLDKPDDRVRFGMSARVAFGAADAVAFAVPRSALFEQAGRPSVWIFDPRRRRVAARAVTVDRYVDDKAVIRGDVLRGEQVVTAGAHRLDPGLEVIAWGGPL